MIILVCKYCRNEDLVPTGVYIEATCANCNKNLQLWEMQTAYLPKDSSALQRNLPELNECNPTLLGVK